MNSATLQNESSVESFFNVVETETLALFEHLSFWWPCGVDNCIQSLRGDGFPNEMMLRTDCHEIQDSIRLFVVKLPVGADEELPWEQMVDIDVLPHLLLMIRLGNATPRRLALEVISFQCLPPFLRPIWPVRNL
jgi:hypothetical protein